MSDLVIDVIAAAKAWRRQFGDPSAYTDMHDMDLIRAVDRLADPVGDDVGELLAYRTADGKLWHPHDVTIVREAGVPENPDPVFVKEKT